MILASDSGLISQNVKNRALFIYLVCILFESSFSFTQIDNLTELTYVKNLWSAASEVEKLSYTSNRVLKPVYNEYERNKFNVVGYIFDHTQYDGRLNEGVNIPNNLMGWGSDLTKVDVAAYDTIVFGFLGIVDEPYGQETEVDTAAKSFQRTSFEATFLDPWADVQACQNNGFTYCKTGDPYELFVEEKAQGTIGGLIKLKNEKNPNLKLSFGIGGWKFNKTFARVSSDPHAVEVFTDSVIDLFRRFPSFSGVVLHWDFEKGTPHSQQESQDFAALIKILKKKLHEDKRSDVLITVSVGSTKARVDALDVPLLLNAGADDFHVFAADYFGSPWAWGLAHRTNLQSSEGNNGWSVDYIVKHLLEKGVPSRKIFIYYMGRSHNARNARIESVSPLIGTYNAEHSTTVGTFQSGVTEFYDIMYNYLDLNESVCGKNNFTLYTDEVSDADFLFNTQSSLFMSFDTPRTVKAKAEYVRKYDLGGLVTRPVDCDGGILVNAAREGFGQEILHETVTMEPYYNKGKTDL